MDKNCIQLRTKSVYINFVKQRLTINNPNKFVAVEMYKWLSFLFCKTVCLQFQFYRKTFSSIQNATIGSFVVNMVVVSHLMFVTFNTLLPVYRMEIDSSKLTSHRFVMFLILSDHYKFF